MSNKVPREARTVWEIDHCRGQTPTLFSSPNRKFKDSARIDWMSIGSPRHPGQESLCPEAKARRKARITLAKVWK